MKPRPAWSDPPRPRKAELNEDFQDLLWCLTEANARFLVVGAHALAVHGVPRATGDIDVWVRPDSSNAERVWRALARFGAPLSSMDLRTEDLARPGTVFQIGLPPRRIDLLTQIDGVEFDSAWTSRAERQLAGLTVPFLGRDDLLKNKKASGRPKDLADLALLESET